MEKTKCPHCHRTGAGFEPSTGEVFCSNCGVLQPPDYTPGEVLTDLEVLERTERRSTERLANAAQAAKG